MTDHLPRAVREASKRADEIHTEVYAPDEKADTPREVTPPPESNTPVSPPASSEPTVVAPDAGSGDVSPPASGGGPASPPAEPPASQPDELEVLRNKFRTLEGKYRAEVPRYASQLREANNRIQHLEQTLANVSTPTSTSTSTPAQSDGSATKSLVTPEEVEEYGEDFVSMMRRLAQEEAGRAVQQVTPKIQEVEGRIQQTFAQTQADRVYSQLDAEIEDWREVNKSRDFLAWLSAEDPYAGTTRAIMLRDAFDQKDGPRVVSFFNGFLNERKLVTPPPPPSSQTPPAREPQVNLADLAGPRGGNGASVPSASPEGPIPWTRRQIASFYHDVQMGVYKTDPQKKAQIEGSINRAVQAGLVTP